MNVRGLDLNLLVAMDALLTERSTTRAGERIYLSQSAMSGALARLRAFFDDELLIQVGQRMVLTPLAFVEMFKFEGNQIQITYTGQVTSDDEIKFTRQVAEFATEELVAKRVK